MTTEKDAPVEVVTKTAIPVGITFKTVFNAVLFLTVLSYVGSIALAMLPTHTEITKTLVEASSTAYRMGFGAIIGLLGGKSLP